MVTDRWNVLPRQWKSGAVMTDLNVVLVRACKKATSTPQHTQPPPHPMLQAFQQEGHADHV